MIGSCKARDPLDVSPRCSRSEKRKRELPGGARERLSRDGGTDTSD